MAGGASSCLTLEGLLRPRVVLPSFPPWISDDAVIVPLACDVSPKQLDLIDRTCAGLILPNPPVSPRARPSAPRASFVPRSCRAVFGFDTASLPRRSVLLDFSPP